MKNQRYSVDGFVPRRAGNTLGEVPGEGFSKEIPSRELHTGDNSATERVGVARTGKTIGEADIAESLTEIDAQQTLTPDGKSSGGSRRGKFPRPGRKGVKPVHPKNKWRRIAKWAAIVLGGLILAIGGYVAYRAITAGESVFRGSILDIVKSDPLQEDENGRSNFLIFGTAEDDEGGTHDGGYLTDSIMVVSVDQEKNDASMVSIPRDLWVQYDDACSVGYEGKINATFFCASNGGEDEEAGARALQAKVGEVLGLDIQYYVHLNFTAVVEVVDAVGGVDVTIESSDPRGILDRNFDWKCSYSCYYVNYENGQDVHLDGEHALALARARNASGGYGLPNGNFDREQNQQKILVALRDKALSAGTLTNVSAVTGIIDALGNNLRTNIETREVRTIMDVASNVGEESVTSLSLVEEDNMLVTTGSYAGQSVVRPIPAIFDYSEIQAYIAKQLTNDPFIKEEPHVTVWNASSEMGVAQTQADALEALGFTVDEVGNAPEGTFDAIEIYQVNSEKSASAQKLASLYGVSEVKTSTPPGSVVGETDFVVIIRDPSAGL